MSSMLVVVGVLGSHSPHHQRPLHQPLRACRGQHPPLSNDDWGRSHPQPPNFSSSTSATNDRSSSKLPPAWRPPIAVHVASCRHSGIPGLAAAVRRWAPAATALAACDRGHPFSTSLQLVDSPSRPIPTGALPLWTAISYRNAQWVPVRNISALNFPMAKGKRPAFIAAPATMATARDDNRLSLA